MEIGNLLEKEVRVVLVKTVKSLRRKNAYTEQENVNMKNDQT